MPSRWLPAVLGEEGGHFGDEAAARRGMELVFALYNQVNDEVRAGRPGLPALVELRRDPADNIGPEAPLEATKFGVRALNLLTHSWTRFGP